MFGRKQAASRPEPVQADYPHSGQTAVAEAAPHNLYNTGTRPTGEPRTQAVVSQPDLSAEKSPANPELNSTNQQWQSHIRQMVFNDMDPAVAMSLSREELLQELLLEVGQLAAQHRYLLSEQEQRLLAETLQHEMLGIGAIEPLMADETVTDIMVNGPDNVFVERHGKLQKADVSFSDEQSLRHVARRIASQVGRRIDESSPMVDARLEDGSRVNIIIPPLALDGTSISIRKFGQYHFSLEDMQDRKSLSPGMVKLLKIATHCRLNMLISGGTGAGKTTLLNAMSRAIDNEERIVTIEDAAELRLQQPHVVRLETRPKSAEGTAEITPEHLLRNALRMRPDRIIVGECRGVEAFQMMQAMNTGHDGSMSTLHANSPQDALIRLENMLLMKGSALPLAAIRRQIASAIHMVVQVSRMRDGVRRVTSISEISGMEGDTILTQELFCYEQHGVGDNGVLQGEFKPRKVTPGFIGTAESLNLKDALLDAMHSPGAGDD